jgi:phosphatidylserine decarboxylase
VTELAPRQLKPILNTWYDFLASPDAEYVLGTDNAGWFGKDGVKALEEVGNVGKRTTPSQRFTSATPMPSTTAMRHGTNSSPPSSAKGSDPSPSRTNHVAVNPCESRVYTVSTMVSARDGSWVKGQPYSVVDMVAFDTDALEFVGGTICQAFLSPLSYHRWHASASGRVKHPYIVPGACLSEPLFEGFTAEHPADPAGEATRQEYISSLVTRTVIML